LGDARRERAAVTRLLLWGLLVVAAPTAVSGTEDSSEESADDDAHHKTYDAGHSGEKFPLHDSIVNVRGQALPGWACGTTEVLPRFIEPWPILQRSTGSIDLMRDTYPEGLDSLSERLVEMTRLARHAVARATTALLDSDLIDAQTVISGDEEINNLYLKFVNIAFSLMERQ